MAGALKLRIEMIPPSCWGKNLRTQVKQSQWKKLRANALAEQGNVCGVCGSDHRLQCHEEWEFDDERHILRLRELRCSCGMCHHVTHFGRAQQIAADGQLDLEAVIEHFLKVNGVGRKEFEAHKQEAVDLFEQRSKHKWEIDFGQWASMVSQKPLP